MKKKPVNLADKIEEKMSLRFFDKIYVNLDENCCIQIRTYLRSNIYDDIFLKTEIHLSYEIRFNLKKHIG